MRSVEQRWLIYCSKCDNLFCSRVTLALLVRKVLKATRAPWLVWDYEQTMKRTMELNSLSTHCLPRDFQDNRDHQEHREKLDRRYILNIFC